MIPRLRWFAWLAPLAVVAAGAPVRAGLAAAPAPRIVEAAKQRDREGVRTLLKQRADVDATQGDGATALHWAAYWDDAEMAGALLQAGAKVNVANDLGVTPLALAAANGSGPLVTKLLAGGADPNIVALSGVSALMQAARVGSAAAVQALLDHGADVRARERARGQTALMWAAAGRHPEVVRLLLGRGADVNDRTRSSRHVVNRGSPTGTDADRPYVGDVEKGGSTALLFAVRVGDIESARLLLAAGADANTMAPDGYSAMLLASHSGHEALALFLLGRGADPNTASAGCSPLHTALMAGQPELLKALLARGAHPNTRLAKGTPIRRQGEDLALPAPLAGATPFLLAAKYAEPEMMRMLAAAGANPLLPLQNGTTPLMAAAGLGWSGQTTRRGIDVTANKSAASDPYEDEVRALESVKVAVELGADVNAANQAGETALFGAAPRGFKTVVQFLADRGARVDARNKRGETLLRVTAPRATAATATPPSMLQATAALLRELGAAE